MSEHTLTRSTGPSVPPTGARSEAPRPDDAPREYRSTRSAPRPAPEPTRPEPKRRASLSWAAPSVVNAKLIYAGYLSSLAIPFLAIVAALFAHEARKGTPSAWLASHYTYQIRTFWIGLAANAAAYALSFVGVGLLFFPVIALWLVARSVKGLIRLANREAIEDPRALLL